jgi:hypothetical protein
MINLIRLIIIIIIGFITVRLFSSYYTSKRQFSIIHKLVYSIESVQSKYLSMKIENTVQEEMKKHKKGFSNLSSIRSTLKDMLKWDFEKSIPGSEETKQKIVRKYLSEIEAIIEEVPGMSNQQKYNIRIVFVNKFLKELITEFYNILELTDKRIKYVFGDNEDLIKSVFKEKSITLFLKFIKNNFTSPEEQHKVFTFYSKEFSKYINSF